MKFVKSAFFASTLLLSLTANAQSLSTLGTVDNGIFKEMQQIQALQPRNALDSADIFFIDSNDFAISDLSKDLFADFNTIVIVGDTQRNKELMIKLVGFGIEREVVAITNIHDISKRQINTYTKGKKAEDKKVATVLMDVIIRDLRKS
ncbi:hypothetical protein [Photobacterium lucens]|uniref:hypothetical protein n=1 Tax=Photobacterium lucens TaxID=2562949 RepID=UPI0006B650FE|nr:hypothetical protein [Photobacterium lucens]KPA51302.1 hypothetical protein VT25_14260 [Photobacterium leiognathi subsp. mandapamensis]MBP2702093.1 hypothetical protein [Vibrio parahaemolyticus]MZG55938.1 hypothetical protein [Photobacterium lucens]MZG80603.1 hypothetical protein [Photobacterium lucens]PSV21338.1 hypothetical protein C0W44_09045 [Photobacterium leiognathi subsp. mandapamensis]